MADMSFDSSELDALSVDLRHLGAVAPAAARGVIAKAGVQMKAAMREEASGSQRFRRIPYSINYELTDGGLGVDVGPDPDLTGGWQKQGRLAHIAYFGSPTSAPRFRDPVGILEREAPVAADYLAKLAGDL